jgi:flavin-dependent dehydrogenase
MQVITRLSIIGGGPAGCAAALSAIKSGIEPSDILIIEKEPYDRHRIG